MVYWLDSYQNPSFFKLRNIPILFLGIFIGQSSGDFLVTIGLLLFSLTLLFQLFTLPVEFNAS
ncbi:hypothetical protein CVR98_24935, partial [Salmonella enterica subsp. enterica serovar Enteritidis]